jgi:hypothetical protein
MTFEELLRAHQARSRGRSPSAHFTCTRSAIRKVAVVPTEARMLEIERDFASELGAPIDPRVRPMDVDPWIASSAFQKAIRGDRLLAQCAALTLLCRLSTAR